MCKTLTDKLKKLSSSVIYSKSTLSEYYTIGCIKVRYSDHLSKNSDADLNLFYNGKNTYVIIPNIGTFKEVQWFNSTSEVMGFIITFEKMAKLLVKTVADTQMESVKERDESMEENTKHRMPSLAEISFKPIESKEDWRRHLKFIYSRKTEMMYDMLDWCYENQCPGMLDKLRSLGAYSIYRKDELLRAYIKELCVNNGKQYPFGE